MKHLNLFGFIIIALSIITSQFNPIQAQTQNLTIGKVGDKSVTYPIKESTHNAITEIIYTIDEIKTPGNIESITFQYRNTQDLELKNFVVWITPYYAPEIIKGQSINTKEELTPVFGEKIFMIPEGSGQITIPFRKPYYYNGKENIAIIIAHEHTQAKENPQFIYSETKNQNTCRVNYNLNTIDYPCDDTHSIISNKRPVTTLAINYNIETLQKQKSSIQKFMKR